MEKVLVGLGLFIVSLVFYYYKIHVKTLHYYVDFFDECLRVQTMLNSGDVEITVNAETRVLLTSRKPFDVFLSGTHLESRSKTGVSKYGLYSDMDIFAHVIQTFLKPNEILTFKIPPESPIHVIGIIKPYPPNINSIESMYINTFPSEKIEITQGIGVLGGIMLLIGLLMTMDVIV